MSQTVQYQSYLNTVQGGSADLYLTIPGTILINQLPAFQLGTQSGCSFISYAAGTAAIWNVAPDGILASTYYVVVVRYYDTTLRQTIQIPFQYFSSVATDALFYTAFSTWATNLLTQFGYTVAAGLNNSTDITAPMNQDLYLAQDTNFGSGVTLVVANSTPAVARIGYGQDIIDTYAFPTATYASANDGVYPTNTYNQSFIPVNPPNSGGSSQYTNLVLIKSGTNGNALLTSLKNALT